MFQFSEIIGQNDVKSSLINQVNSGKLHHAHLFLGKMGFGTLQLAMAFQKYVYCLDRRDSDSCDQCANCVKINKLSHVDVHYTFPSFKSEVLSDKLMNEFREIMIEENGLFDIRDWVEFNKEKNYKVRAKECDIILHNMGLSSYEDGYKTQVIWMAEDLKTESNKILKILEEPNPNTIFILICESAEKVLPTILSRCNIHRVLPLRDEFLSEFISLKAIPCNAEQKSRAITFSEGDLIEVKRYLQDDESEFSIEEILLEFLRGLISFSERKFSNINKSIKVADILSSKGQSKTSQKKFLDYLQYFIRQVVLTKISNTSNLNPKLAPAAGHFAKIMDLDQIEIWSKIVDKCYRSIEGNANVKISFVSLAIESGKIQSRNELEAIVNKN